MSSFLFIFAIILYGFLLAALFVFGMNFLYLALLAWRKRGPDPQASGRAEHDAPAGRDGLPYVSVQLPVFNELYVVERLIDAAANLDWDPARLEILVLDDSTDETRELVQKRVEHWQQQGVNIRQLHRTERVGFKAGALAAGMALTRAEFLAYFDADFVPARDFLRRTVPHLADPRVAFVQTRWGHINREYSLLTYLQSLAIDAHFVVEQFARSRGGYWFNFNGTAGVWRRAALEDAGGWRADTLTEDLDVSYRAFLRGWQARYLRDVVSPAELPVTFSAYHRQQHRWAKGSLECAIKLLPQVWASDKSFIHKLEATLHLTGYTVHLFMFVLMLIYPAVVYYSTQFPQLLTFYGVAALLGLSGFAPTLYFTLAQKELGGGWLRKFPLILFLTALGAGMMPNTVRAAWQLLVGRGKMFERTPKFGIAARSEKWTGKRYQLRFDRIVLFEALVAIWNAASLVYSLQTGNWMVAFYAFIFVVGAIFVAGLSIRQTLAAWSFRRQSVARSIAAGA